MMPSDEKRRHGASGIPYETDAFDFPLPGELIAQVPPADRDAGRLLIVDRATGALKDAKVADLAGLFGPKDILVFNDTRVIRARIEARRADTGGNVEVLIVQVGDRTAEALVRTRGRLAPGCRLVSAGTAADAITLSLDAPLGEGLWRIDTGLAACDLLSWLERFGRVPLPPYIRRAPGADARDAVDAERYQTLVASRPGAIAAPTAGLHFSRALLDRIDARGVRRTCVTLHVGPGTFRPVAAADIREHRMHSERFEVSGECAGLVRATRARGGRVVAIGTTAVRSLESASRSGEIAAASGATDLFIHPPYAFKSVDALVTNFHAPRSTLLMLTAAFAGRELVLRAYEHAISGKYRLLSYGDAMVIV